ncbi:MAG: hypothetical protein R3244_07720 [Thermoanaerobaculia bacterium]|nr:hypothetical protein [Thermoanaerobaculia bacterium]
MRPAPGMRVFEIVTGGHRDLTEKCIDVDPEKGYAVCVEKVVEDFVPIRRHGRFVIETEVPERATG